MPDDDREHMWALYLNAQNHLLEVYPVSTGTPTASLVHPRESFKDLKPLRQPTRTQGAKVAHFAEAF